MALTNKQRIFVAEYVVDFNATRAAIAAGYSENSARAIGHENLTKPDIAAEIGNAISHRCMTKDEVLIRLAEHARGSMDDFTEITPAGPLFDFNKAKKAGKLHLIKKLKTKTKTYITGEKDNEELVTEVEVDFELYDAQSALEKIGRVHKLFTDKVDINAKNIHNLTWNDGDSDNAAETT